MNVTNHVLSGRRTIVRSCLNFAFYIFLAVGLLAIGYAGYTIVDAQTYQAIHLREFSEYAPIVEQHRPEIGEQVGEIEIPRLALKTVILQGESPLVLRRGVGHLPETPMPGERGNIGLAGHRDSFFRPLRQIRSGDLITLHTLKERFQYRVESTRIVSPSDVDVLSASDRRELTLITCFPFNYVGAARDRFIVRAFQVSEPKE